MFDLRHRLRAAGRRLAGEVLAHKQRGFSRSWLLAGEDRVQRFGSIAVKFADRSATTLLGMNRLPQFLQHRGCVGICRIAKQHDFRRGPQIHVQRQQHLPGRSRRTLKSKLAIRNVLSAAAKYLLWPVSLLNRTSTVAASPLPLGTEPSCTSLCRAISCS